MYSLRKHILSTLSTNQKHYPDLCSDASLVWNFCARFSNVISLENQCWRRQVFPVSLG